jgi:hypothetical protein
METTVLSPMKMTFYCDVMQYLDMYGCVVFLIRKIPAVNLHYPSTQLFTVSLSGVYIRLKVQRDAHGFVCILYFTTFALCVSGAIYPSSGAQNSECSRRYA